MTQQQASELAGLSSKSRWAEYETGLRRPAASLWELWLILTDQHPLYRLVRRRR